MITANKNKMLSSVLWAAIRVWGNRLGGILIFFVLARLLSPEDLGIYSAIWAILLFLEVFTEQGLADAIIQTPNVDKAQINTAFIVNLGMALIISFAIVFFAQTIADYMGMPKIVHPLQVATLAMIFNALGFCQLALYRRNFEYRWLAIRTLTATFISGAVGIAFAFAGFGAWALISQFVIAAFINLIWLWARPIWKPSMEFTLEGLSELMSFSLKLMFARICDAVSNRAFELAIGAWMGAATLGIFAVGSRIYTVMIQLLSNVMLDVAHTGFSRLAEDKSKFLEGYYKAVTATVALAVPIFVIMAAISHEFCIALFGVRWAQSGDTLYLLGLLGAVQCIQSINVAAINGLGLTSVQFGVALIKVIFTVIVLWVYGHKDFNTLLLAYVVMQLPLCPLSFIWGRKYIHFSWNDLIKKTYPFLLATLIAFAVIGLARVEISTSYVWINLIVLFTLGVLVYVLSVATMRPQYVGIARGFIVKKLKK